MDVSSCFATPVTNVVHKSLTYMLVFKSINLKHWFGMHLMWQLLYKCCYCTSTDDDVIYIIWNNHMHSLNFNIWLLGTVVIILRFCTYDGAIEINYNATHHLHSNNAFIQLKRYDCGIDLLITDGMWHCQELFTSSD